MVLNYKHHNHGEVLRATGKVFRKMGLIQKTSILIERSLFFLTLESRSHVSFNLIKLNCSREFLVAELLVKIIFQSPPQSINRRFLQLHTTTCSRKLFETFERSMSYGK